MLDDLFHGSQNSHLLIFYGYFHFSVLIEGHRAIQLFDRLISAMNTYFASERPSQLKDTMQFLPGLKITRVFESRLSGGRFPLRG